MNSFDWSQPATIAEAAAATTATVAEAMSGAASALAVVKAGGVDVLDLMKEGLVAPSRIVNLRAIPGLDQIAANHAGNLHIGTLVTLATLAEHRLVREHCPVLAEASAAAGSAQLRNQATIGGNLLQRPHCWYFRSPHFACRRKGGVHCFALAGENQYHAIIDNDLCAIVHPSSLATVLVALGASVALSNAQGVTRRVLLEDFFLSPAEDVTRENDLRRGEILIAIDVPLAPGTARFAYLRQGEKAAFDWPLADVAVMVDVAADGVCQHARIVLGAAAPVPYRSREAEKLLRNALITEAQATAAAQTAIAAARPLAKNVYKVPMFVALIRRAILRAAQDWT